MRRKLMWWLSLAWVLGAQPVGAATALDALVLSPGTSVMLDLAASGEQPVAARAAVRYSAAGAALVPLGLPEPPAGLISNLSAYHEAADGSIYFSLSASETLSGVSFEPRDVIRWNGSSYSLHFRGLSRGVPAGVAITSFAKDANGTDLLSFDGPFFSAAGTLITPFDVVAWAGAAPSLWLQTIPTGVSASAIAIDALTVLANGHVLISFANDAVVSGMPRADEDVLEYDPISGSWELAVDSSDLDPDWAAAGVKALYAKPGPANVGVPESVVVRMAIVDALAAPRRYELRLECGPHRVRDIGFGVAMAANVTAASLLIGPCGATGCAAVNPTQFGPTVDPSTAIVDFSPEPDSQRDDAIYVELSGAGGGLLCQPGQDVLLAQVQIAYAATGFLPAPLPTAEGAAESYRQGGAVLPGHLIRYAAGALDPLVTVIARPACEGEAGLRFDLTLEASERLHQLGLALLFPDGVSASQVSFEGCTTLEDPDLNEQSCDGATQLGAYVDAAASSTLGPAAALAAGGGHPGAMYLNLRGSAASGALPALNFPGRRTLLGRIRYAGAVPISRRQPPLVLIAGQGTLDQYMIPWFITGGDVMLYSGGSGEGESSNPLDSDLDGQCDDVDLCNGSPNNTDTGGVGVTPPVSVQDGIGDDCQCGDVTPDGIVDQNDVTRIRSTLAGAQTLSPVLAKKCGVSPFGQQGSCDLSDQVVLYRRLYPPPPPEPPDPPLVPPELQVCGAP